MILKGARAIVGKPDKASATGFAPPMNIIIGNIEWIYRTPVGAPPP